MTALHASVVFVVNISVQSTNQGTKMMLPKVCPSQIPVNMMLQVQYTLSKPTYMFALPAHLTYNLQYL